MTRKRTSILDSEALSRIASRLESRGSRVQPWIELTAESSCTNAEVELTYENGDGTIQRAAARSQSQNESPDDAFCKRLGSLNELPTDMVALGAGFYRQGHTIWELRGAEDEDGGYVLTRKVEERAVDLRDDRRQAEPRETAEKTASKTAMMNPYKVGDIVRYSSRFLRSVGWNTNVPKNGLVVGIEMGLGRDEGGFPIIRWSDGRPEVPVNPANLEPTKKRSGPGDMIASKTAQKRSTWNVSVRQGTEANQDVPCAACRMVGKRVALVRSGQVMPVLVLKIHDNGHAEVENDEGHSMDAPTDMLMGEDEVPMPKALEVVEEMLEGPVGEGEALVADGDPLASEPMGDDQAAMEDAFADEAGFGEAETVIHSCDCDMGCQCPCHGEKRQSGEELFADTRKKEDSDGLEGGSSPAPNDAPADNDMPGESADEPAGDDRESDDKPEFDEELQRDAELARWRYAERAARLEEYKLIEMQRKAFEVRALNFDSAWGSYVTPTRAFSPVYMGGQYAFDPEQRESYMVEGAARADQMSDKMYGVPNPVYNTTKQGDWFLNDRIRLVPHNGGPTIFISPAELESNFERLPELAQRQRSFSRPNVPLDQGESNNMPGESVFSGPSQVDESLPTATLTPWNSKTQVGRPPRR